MKTALIVVGILLTIFCHGAAPRNELERAEQATTRVIYEYPVSIEPLVKWRKFKEGPRPMTAWQYFTGRITRAGAGEWEMEITLEGDKAPQRIVLRNPPVAALKEFTALNSEYAALHNNVQNAFEVANDAHHADEVARANVIATPLPGGEKRVSQVLANQRNFDNAIAARDATRAENVLAAADVTAATRSFRQFDNKGYPIPGTFMFRGYAVLTKEKHASGLPLYDHGTYR